MSNALRQVRAGTVRFRDRDFAHPALEILPDGEAVWVVADGPHRVAVWRYRQRRTETPLCVAAPARLRREDPDQSSLFALPS